MPGTYFQTQFLTRTLKSKKNQLNNGLIRYFSDLCTPIILWAYEVQFYGRIQYTPSPVCEQNIFRLYILTFKP
jgi:hypothetical protein